MDNRLSGSQKKIAFPHSYEWSVNDHINNNFNNSNLRNITKLKQAQFNENFANQNHLIYPRSFVSKLFNPNDRIFVENFNSVQFPNLIGQTHQSVSPNLRRMSSQIKEDPQNNLSQNKGKNQNEEAEELINTPKNENIFNKNKIRKGLCLNMNKKKKGVINPKIAYQNELISVGRILVSNKDKISFTNKNDNQDISNLHSLKIKKYNLDDNPFVIKNQQLYRNSILENTANLKQSSLSNEIIQKAQEFLNMLTNQKDIKEKKIIPSQTQLNLINSSKFQKFDEKEEEPKILDSYKMIHSKNLSKRHPLDKYNTKIPKSPIIGFMNIISSNKYKVI